MGREESFRCLYCRGDTGRPSLRGVRDRLHHVAGDFDYWRCADCGSATLHPLPEEREIPSFYPPAYMFEAERSVGARIAELVLYRPMFRRQLAKMKVRGGSLLDIGCGTGNRLKYFAEHGFAAEGIDFDARAVEIARRRGLRAHVGTGLAREFDVVTAFYVFEHVLDPVAFAQACATMLRDDGLLVAQVPLVDSWQAKIFGKRWSGATEVPRHVSLPSREGMRRALASAGFTDIVVVADTTINCAGTAALSALPNVGHRSIARLAVGAAVSAAALPFSWIENYVLRRPSIGLVTARPPRGRSRASARNGIQPPPASPV